MYLMILAIRLSMSGDEPGGDGYPAGAEDDGIGGLTLDGEVEPEADGYGADVPDGTGTLKPLDADPDGYGTDVPDAIGMLKPPDADPDGYGTDVADGMGREKAPVPELEPAGTIDEEMAPALDAGYEDPEAERLIVMVDVHLELEAAADEGTAPALEPAGAEYPDGAAEGADDETAPALLPAGAEYDAPPD